MALAAAGIAVEDLGLRQPSLDDVFLTLTGARRVADRTPPTSSEELPDERRIASPRRAATPARGNALSDIWVIAWRGLLHMRRQPEALADATIQPIMFVLLFAYVFGGAIAVPGGGDYKEFLMGGIFAQTIVFGVLRRGHGASPPTARTARSTASARCPSRAGAVLGGHAVANLIKSLLPIVLMSICGLIVGWRTERLGRRGRRPTALMLAVRLRDDLGRRAARQRALLARGRAGRRVRGDLPDHVHREHVRAGQTLPGRCGRSRSGTRSRRSPRRCGTCSATRTRRAPAIRGRWSTRRLTR